MSRRTSPGRGAELAVAGDDVELVVQARHAGAARARGRLEGGDDELGELPPGVQHGERVDHRHDRRAGVGDDAAWGGRATWRGVDLGHDERHVGVGAERRAVVDDDDPARRPPARPSARRSRRDVEHRDVDAVEELRGQRLDDDVLAADPAAREPTSSAPAASRTSPQMASRVGRTSSTTRADGAGGAHDAEGRPRDPRARVAGAATSAAGASVDDGLALGGVEPEGRVHRPHGVVEQVVAGDRPRCGSPRSRSSRC